MIDQRTITLRLHADAAWIPMVQGLAEQCGTVFGLDHGKTLRLTMAVEEILAYLAELTPQAPLELIVTPGASHVDTTFSFAARDADLWAMNLTACGADCAEENLQAMGLLLAARMSDGLEARRDGANVLLRLRMDRTYPDLDPRRAERFAPRGAVSFRPALDPSLIKEACALAASLYPQSIAPPDFRTPGKVVDRILGGELFGALAVDQGGNVCGFMTWEPLSATSVSFCGPYVFTAERASVARGLTEHLVGAVARTPVAVILSRMPTEDLPREEFELLGTLPLTDADGAPAPLNIWYRDMREDNGLAVWTHPELKAFLHAEYERLFLMRDIHLVSHQGEQVAGRSVFATSIQPEASQALLIPMLDGTDASDTLRGHVQLLTSEGYRNILVHLDLAHGWQAAMAPALLENGFQPRVLLPHAGQADVMVLQHAGS
jgi:hypothetical protein